MNFIHTQVHKTNASRWSVLIKSIRIKVFNILSCCLLSCQFICACHLDKISGGSRPGAVKDTCWVHWICRN